MNQENIVLHVMSDGDRTVAEAIFNDYSMFQLTIGRGSSGREPGDKADPVVGENLAVARALTSLAKKLERRAAGRMRHIESLKAHKEQIRCRDLNIPTPAEVSAMSDAARGEEKRDVEARQYFDRSYHYSFNPGLGL